MVGGAWSRRASCGYVRFWLKRDFDKHLDDMKQHEVEYDAREKAKSAAYVNAITNLTDATFGSNAAPTDSITSASL